MIQSRTPASHAAYVHEQLRENILSGVLKPGERLVESDLAQRLGVSQGPVREALARLREEGLIIALPHRGSFVSEITVEEARDLYVTREYIERRAIALALPHLGDEQYALLEQDIAAMTEAVENGRFPENIAHDMRFHGRLFEWSQSPTLQAFWSHTEARTRKFIAVASPQVFSDHVGVAKSHFGFIEALKTGNAKTIDRELHNHLSAIWTRLEDASS
jgi:DNA-binding GntR family transcriptional regulator